ncbi:carbon storage regulator CsrA [Tautonia rosea]|uniref:carbon storage regulator CsrA n=1 Tax=Tautonia rosea TaxID=2728037 RepID=UPI001472EA0D|nr:carbon storage regulator CsrA [Tautonia rosea]
MLVLSRKIGERIRIGDTVTLTVVRVHGDKVRLGIEAPESVTIHREEVYQRLQREPTAASSPSDDDRALARSDAESRTDASLSSAPSRR